MTQTAPVAPRNGLATAGLVLGILGICLFWLTGLGALLGLVAVILGAVGVSTARRHEGRPQQTQAWIGIVTGILAIVLSIGALVAVTVLGNNAQDTFDRVSRDLESDFDSTNSGIDDVNSDPSNGSCNPDRYLQDPDC